MWNKYGKAIAAVVAAILAVVASATTGDGHISPEEWMQILLAGLTAASVYLVPAVPEWPWMKTAIAALIVAVETGASLIIDGLSVNDIVNIVIAILGVVFVGLAPTDTEQRHVSTRNPTLILLAVALGGAVALTGAQPVRADTSDEFATCWQPPSGAPYNGNVGVGPNFSWPTGQGGSSASGYSYSPPFQVPGSPYTGCEDINVDNGIYGHAGEWRVRFYPSSGGNFTNAWRPSSCAASWCQTVIATNVSNGTWYRVEWRDYLPSCGCYSWGDNRFWMAV